MNDFLTVYSKFDSFDKNKQMNQSNFVDQTETDKTSTLSSPTKKRKIESITSDTGEMTSLNTDEHLIVILDESGSMRAKADQMLTALNSLIEEQRERCIRDNKNMFFTLWTFSSMSKLVFNTYPIHEVKPITHAMYKPDGTTALYDTIAKAIILNLNNKFKTICVIITDGLDNSSQDYDQTRVQQLTHKISSEKDWSFIYLAENIDQTHYVDQILPIRLTQVMSDDGGQNFSNTIHDQVRVMSRGISSKFSGS